MNIMLIIKGIIVGIAKVIPGLSGAVFMISFNLYDKAIQSITNFFDDVRDNFLFLLNLGIGVLIGIVCFSNVILFLINNYYVFTISLFAGLIMGGIYEIKNSCNKINYYIFVVAFLLLLGISIVGISSNYVLSNGVKDYFVLFFSGIVEAFGTVIPGISSTALLMIIGVYNIYINILSNIYSISFVIHNFIIIISFGLGLILGLIFFIFMINYLFRKYRDYSYSFIFGLCSATIVLLLIKVFDSISNVYSLVVSLLLLVIGYLVGREI